MTKLSVNHIRHAKTSQIARLLGKKVAAVSRWNNSDFVTGCVDSQYQCITKQDLVAGLISRKERIDEFSRLQKEFDEILDSSEKITEPISA